MKRIIGTFLAALIVTASATSVPACADWENRGGKTYYQDENGKYLTGWQTVGGKDYYFKKNGEMLTKNTVIDGVRYKFGKDGVCAGKFTGWTSSSEGRRYWKKGVLQKNKWIVFKSGKIYYAGNDGYLTTGWAEVSRNGGRYSYFDENGVWDGNVYNEMSFDEEIAVSDTAVKRISGLYAGDYCVISDDGIYYANISKEPSWAGTRFTKGEFIGKVLYNTTETDLSRIKPFSASALPAGTKLYQSNEQRIVIVAELGSTLVPYLKIVEG